MAGPSNPSSEPGGGLGLLARLAGLLRRRGPVGQAVRSGLGALRAPVRGTLEMDVLGRVLLHAALVGLAAGLLGAAFFAGLEWTQRFLLETLAGFRPLQARGEHFLPEAARPQLRVWLLVLLPAAGALAGGLITRLAPDARGGGGEAAIAAFHHRGGYVRPRVIWVRALASIFTLGAGGSGGREGPTMQIGGAIGSTVAGVLRLGARERRLLFVAGVAAGISAVFRTPLGAALLAVEMLYREDFESDALVPAVLSSVVAYSVVDVLFGQTVLFAPGRLHPFDPAHLPLYALLAVLVSLVAAGFVSTLHSVRRLSAGMPVPAWAKPAMGGLALGLVVLPPALLLSHSLGAPGSSLGVLGGGYGAAQLAMTGAAFLPGGWAGVALLGFMCAAKVVASSLTIGTGGSAGDFAPSLVIGALFGGAFGRAAQLLLGDPTIDPAAFALVGMGTFYGGIAHVPLAALVLVSEMAGSYDLLVPMMLAVGIATVALRKRALYSTQVPTRQDSPVHRAPPPQAAAPTRPVGEFVDRRRAPLCFPPSAPARSILEQLSERPDQDVFPVVAAQGRLTGLITADALRLLAAHRDLELWTVAADLARPPAWVSEDEDLGSAAKQLLAHGLGGLPVLDAQGRVVAVLAEADVARWLLEGQAAAEPAPTEAAAAS